MLPEYLLWRGSQAVTVVWIFIEWGNRYFSDEVLLLEELKPADVPTRLRHLHSPIQSSTGASMLATATVMAVGVGMLCFSWQAIKLVVFNQIDWHWSLDRFCDPSVVLAFVLAHTYAATAKFLLYLNHRTTYEGWDVFLQVRRVLIRWDERQAGPLPAEPAQTAAAGGGV
jgi:hypothetical protein